MPKTTKKRDLPTKVCPVCGKPFTWCTKWKYTWPEVRYCSDKCRQIGRTRPSGQ